MLERIKSFGGEEMARLHDATLQVMGEVGVAFHDEEAVSIFKNRGFTVDGRTVFFEESQVADALETAPSQFEMTARDPNKSVIMGGDALVIAPGYGSPFIIGEHGDQRPGVREDYGNLCRLVQTSPHIDMNGMLMVHPSDAPPDTAHLDMLLANMTLCDKPFLGSSSSRDAAADSLKMAQLLWGGAPGRKDRHVMMAIISSLSPLQYSEEMAGALITYARHGQPVMVGLLMMAGSTGPVTLAGLLTVQNAEMLAGIVLAQLVNPGTPVVYGGTSSITDLRLGSLAVGAPELSLIQCAQAQFGRFYGIPIRGSGGISDAHAPDMQAGIESTLALATTIMSGSNFILHGCGILSSYNAMSFEKFLIDEEICGMLRRMLRPIEVTDESIGLSVIREVGAGGEYLSHPTTFEKCRTEFYLPTLMNRADYESWRRAGRKRADQRAAEMLVDRLGAYEKPDIDPSVGRDLERYVAERRGV